MHIFLDISVPVSVRAKSKSYIYYSGDLKWAVEQFWDQSR